MNRLGSGFALLLIAAGLTGCQQATSTDSPAPPPRPAPAAGGPTRQATHNGLLKAHHELCVDQFVKTEGFGFGRFTPLAAPAPTFPKSLDLPADSPELDDAGKPLPPRPVTWVMDKVELVSLLVADRPGIYTTQGMHTARRLGPRLRDLDAFEEQALAKLRAGEALQVADAPGQLRVLGAVRMQPACAKCHNLPEGSLLGAFSYAFKSTAAAR